MGEREGDKIIEQMRSEGKKVYSISRLNTIDQCPYQAYLNYVKGEEQEPNIWACMGGKIHDALEKCVKDGQDTAIIKQALEEELGDLDIFGIDFPKDKNGNPTMRNNWIANMTRFAEEFKTPKGKFVTEEFVLYKIDDTHYMQGYIDLQRINNDGSLWIVDWKTSSQFDKNHLVSAGRQLVLYALAKQAQGYEVKKASWCMLKYFDATWTQKNGKTKNKIGEWRNLVKDLKNVIVQKLEAQGMDELDIDICLEEALKTNQIPKQVCKEFRVLPYVRDYEITQEVIDETLAYIKEKIKQYEDAGDDEKGYPPCDIESNSFFCASLCGYKSKCVYWQDYCAQFNKEEENDEDLF